ncbi:DinB family protein [Chryseobacterium sp. C-71]|uniref:DinB family protein n=1 Tax=Chryseobacterium sp. C-71 TaxID=2893882 RepID=UPI001E2A8C34|nr:DinB family protein [Chryseobacterium sp. C-71]UFH30734.1 DinB family protein [Chryseobacterium sp. C-71]
MSTPSQLAKRFREVLLDGRWIANTNFKDQLSDVTWEQATTKIADVNTIAMLTFHIDYYIAGILNVFEGGDLEIKDQFSFDLPPIGSQEQWEVLLNKLLNDSEKFATLLEEMPDSKMNEVFVDEKYGTYLRNIDGMIEHAYYHLGQIALIKKMILFKFKHE